MPCEDLALIDGGALLIEGWLDSNAADHYFERLLADVAWEQHQIRVFGRRVATPRLSAWYGDPGARYGYSGVALEPLPWLPAISELKSLAESQGHGDHGSSTYNSVLLNLYRDGSDSMGWHSDDEPELGDRPVIGSLSLGAERRFLLKRRGRADVDRVELTLSHGSLLIMYGDTQRNWKHSLPKSSGVREPRINLTFRLIR